jgi:hypothetical protein
MSLFCEYHPPPPRRFWNSSRVEGGDALAACPKHSGQPGAGSGCPAAR